MALEKMLKRVLGTAEQTFPSAQVCIPMINFNWLLPREERMLLRDLNGYINSTGKAIENISYGQFHM